MLFGAPKVEPRGGRKTLADRVAVEALGLTPPEVDLPASLSFHHFEVAGGERRSYSIDRRAFEELFDRIDLREVRVPRRLAAATVSVDIQPALSIVYRQGQRELRLTRTAPANVKRSRGADIAVLAEFGLRVAGVEEHLAHQISAATPWLDFVTAPFPGGEVDYQLVDIGGIRGILRSPSQQPGSTQQLLWSCGEQRCWLEGPWPTDELLQIAGSVR
jgi:hypothetical protein